MQVHLRDDQQVDRGSRADVLEGEQFVVLVDLLAGDLAGSDLAEDAVRVAVHGALRVGR
jgi:hypothetical protein